MALEPKEKAIELLSEFSLVILAELGHKLPLDNIKSLGKASVLKAVDEIMLACNNPEGTYYINNYYYWQKVKKELEKL